MKEYTVSELTREIKYIIEENIGYVRVIGEISNFKHYTPTGHLYFTLKDEYAELRCVMFEGGRCLVASLLKDGMKVRVWGRVGVYEKKGRYQLYVEDIEPAGMGELAIKFELLKKKLAEEGLFHERYKKPLPRYPLRIGVVTSKEGAAIRDIVRILKRRFPGVEIILRPAPVQGEGASFEIARAIDEFNEYGRVDLLIVGRGGGSLEDLWAFNEEVVARAIFRSRIPVISAVGHEKDFTIADYVADRRAATPSEAAEIAVRSVDTMLREFSLMMERMGKALMKRIGRERERIERLERSYVLRRPLDRINQKKETLDFLIHRMERALSGKVMEVKHRLALLVPSFRHFEKMLEKRRERLESMEKELLKVMGRFIEERRKKIEGYERNLQALGPYHVLSRGYAIVRKDGRIVRSSEEVEVGERVDIWLAKGRLKGRVEEKS